MASLLEEGIGSRLQDIARTGVATIEVYPSARLHPPYFRLRADLFRLFLYAHTALIKPGSHAAVSFTEETAWIGSNA
jgi:hypothetical protein